MPTIRVRLSKWLGGQFAVTSRVVALLGCSSLGFAVLCVAGDPIDRIHASLQLVGFVVNAFAAFVNLRRVIHERSYEAGLLVGKAAHPPAHQIVIVDAQTFHRLAHLPPSAFIPRDQ